MNIATGVTGTDRDGVLSATKQRALNARQSVAAAAVTSYWKAASPQHPYPLLALPTGIGKGRIAQLIMETSQHEKILLIVGTKNVLLRQNMDALTDFVREETGIETFSLLPDTSARVVICTWQGLGAWLRKDIEHARFGLVVVDEAHNSGTEARLRILTQLAPDHGVGLTATSYRSSGTYKAPEDYGFTVVDSTTLPEAINERWLSPLVGIAIDSKVILPAAVMTGMSLSGAKLGRALSKHPLLFENIARTLATNFLPKGMKTIIAVNRVREEGCVIARTLQELGFKVGLAVNQRDTMLLSGEFTTYGAIERYKLPHDHPDAIQILISPQVVGEGFDAPATECIVWAAPTLSALRYTQVMGRGCRRCFGKAYCLVVDFVYLIEDYGYSLSFAQFFKKKEIQYLEGGFMYVGPGNVKVDLPLTESFLTNARILSIVELTENPSLPEDWKEWKTSKMLAAELGRHQNTINSRLPYALKKVALSRQPIERGALTRYSPETKGELSTLLAYKPRGSIQAELGVTNSWIKSRLPYVQKALGDLDHPDVSIVFDGLTHYSPAVIELLRRIQDWKHLQQVAEDLANHKPWPVLIKKVAGFMDSADQELALEYYKTGHVVYLSPKFTERLRDCRPRPLGKPGTSPRYKGKGSRSTKP
jgi:superfamily II DNA or RNA helicase